jgi:hypothetical protein
MGGQRTYKCDIHEVLQIAMVHVVPMTSRRSVSLIGSKHRGIWNIYDITSLADIPVVLIYALGPELTIPGVKKMNVLK